MLSPDFVDQRCPVFWPSIIEMDPCSGPCRLHLIDNNPPSFRFLCGGALSAGDQWWGRRHSRNFKTSSPEMV